MIYCNRFLYIFFLQIKKIKKIKEQKIKTTLKELSEATRLSWGIDPYDYQLDGEVLDLENMVGSIADIEGDKIIEFKILAPIDDIIEDYEIEITNIEQYPEIEENL